MPAVPQPPTRCCNTFRPRYPPPTHFQPSACPSGPPYTPPVRHMPFRSISGHGTGQNRHGPLPGPPDRYFLCPGLSYILPASTQHYPSRTFHLTLLTLLLCHPVSFFPQFSYFLRYSCFIV